MITIDQQRLRTRSEAYRCLAALFCEPELETWRADAVVSRLLDSTEHAFPHASAAARVIAQRIDDEVQLDLQREYARLFIGPGRLLAPPYGSIYLDPDRRLMGPSTTRAIDAYAEAGLVLADDARDAPDHIAIELEFLQFLDWKELESKPGDEVGRWIALRREFLRSLVAPWVPALATAIRASALGPFYSALADCAEQVVAADAECEG